VYQGFDFLKGFSCFRFAVNPVIAAVDIFPEYTAPRNTVRVDERLKNFVLQK
jgi:hypothetical protein